jgi:hypothetical protein
MKLKTLAAVAATCLALAACSRGGDVVSRGIDGTIKIWTDAGTGCQYILTDDVMIVRQNAYGHPHCPNVDKIEPILAPVPTITAPTLR